MLLDIWAPWCGPCKQLGPVLEKLEAAYAGRFKLAKLNSDEQPEIAGQLSQMFGVRSIPFCVLFDRGQPVDGFVGALPEAEIRKFLDKHVPSEDEARRRGTSRGRGSVGRPKATPTPRSPSCSRRSRSIRPTTRARFDYVKLLLETGRVGDAKRGLRAGRRQGALVDARLAALGHWIAACEQRRRRAAPRALAAAIAANKRDFDARFELAQTHFAARRFTQAMDELLEIVMRDKAWNDELARKTYVAILELMSKPRRKPAAAPRARRARSK